MAVSFQVLRPSSMRASRRRVCSSWLDLEPVLHQDDAGVDDGLLHRRDLCRKRSTSSVVQNPMTRSTPARLYQLRSKITTSPAAGRWGM